jgi:cell division protein FtsI/penicillin-binding protein 2
MRGTTGRIAVVCLALVLLFTVFAWRLIHLQVFSHDYFAGLAAQKHESRKTIPAKRGRILDRNGEELAVNIPVRTVTADGTHIKDPAALAAVAAPFLDMNPRELASKLSTVVDAKRPYVVIKKEVAEERAQDMIRAVEKARLHGLSLEEDSERSYPNAEILCHVLGFIDHSGRGIDGIEKACDRELRGEDGFRMIEHDRKGVEIVVYRGQEQPPRDGSDIRLSIDMGLQAIVENELEGACRELHPAGAAAILADPETGEILAMSCRPNFDPNKFNEAKPEGMRNRIITDMYEPGSVFKIVVASAALNEGIVSDKTRIYCENGLFHYGGKTIKDHHKASDLGLAEILQFSSNIGSAKMALMMKDQLYYDYVRSFGFGEKTGLPLQGEISGMVNPPSRWDMLTKTRMAFGQSVAVTPIQMLMAMSAVANGGKLVKPRIILNKGEGSVTVPQAEPRQVVKPETAKFIATALERVVSQEGTAPLAKIEGFHVAGKTGTAQKISPRGGYLDGRYTVSFAGFFPAQHPRLVGLVIVDDAKIGSQANYGGLIAAPVFSKIGTRAARYLDIQPEVSGAMAQASSATPQSIVR